MASAPSSAAASSGAAATTAKVEADARVAGTRRIEMDARLATDARAPERRVVERPRRLEATTATRVETVVERSAVAISSVSTWVRARNGFRRAIGQRYPPPAAANWIEKSPQKASKNSSHETAVERI